MRYNILKSKMALAGEDIGDLANVVGVQKRTMYKKLNGGIEWSLDNIKAVKEHYKLKPSEVDDIFFTD